MTRTCERSGVPADGGALRRCGLLSSAAHAHALSQVAAEHQLRVDPVHHPASFEDDTTSVSSATWDAALVQTQLDEILGPAASSATSTAFPAAKPRTTTPAMTRPPLPPAYRS